MAAESAPEGDRALRGRGFPTTRDEEWKFTSVASIADRHFAPAHDGQSGLTTDLVERWTGALGGYRLVLVNGAYAPQFSVGELPAGVMCPVCGLSWPRTRRPWSRISAGSPPDRPGVHGAEHGVPPGRRVRVDPRQARSSNSPFRCCSCRHRPRPPACRTRAF